jgi:Ni/Fe-hydrogenase subunit HybB-like protein
MSTASMHGGTASKSGAVLVIAAIGLLISGGWVISQLMSQGHAVYNVNSMGLHWGLPIVVYDFFLLTSTGLAIVATLSLLFGGVGFRPLVKRTLWLAVAGLAGGVAVLALELGHPFRALIAIPFSFAFASPLWWKVLFVTAYVVALLWMLVRMNAPGWKFESVRISAVFTLVLALAVTVTAGIVYGSQSFRAFWASGDISMAFVFEALLGGLAFTFFFTYLAFGFRGQALPEAVRAALHGRLPSLFALAI